MFAAPNSNGLIAWHVPDVSYYAHRHWIACGLPVSPLRHALVVMRVDFYASRKNEYRGVIGCHWQPGKNLGHFSAFEVSNIFDVQKITISVFAPNGREYNLAARLKF